MVLKPAHRAGACLSLALAVSSTAQAQSNTAPTTADEAPAKAATPSSADATKDAGEHYTRGLSLYADGEFLLALVEFERAYQLSQNYKVLYNIGQVRIQLGRYAKGREALEQYLEAGGGGISPERSQAVKADLLMLTERTATLHLVVNEAGADISLDGKSVGTSPLAGPLVVDSGEHNLVLHKAGFYDQSQSLTLAGHDQIDVKIDLVVERQAATPKVIVERHTEPVVASKPSRAGVWVGWATTGALAATAGVVGYFGISKANQLQSMRTEFGVTRSQLDGTKSSAGTLLTISDISAGLAAVAGGISLYLTLSGPHEHPAGPQAAPAVSLGFGPGSLRLRGAF